MYLDGYDSEYCYEDYIPSEFGLIEVGNDIIDNDINKSNHLRLRYGFVGRSDNNINNTIRNDNNSVKCNAIDNGNNNTIRNDNNSVKCNAIGNDINSVKYNNMSM